MEKTITLIRHGKTPGNYEKRYIGITDEGMTLDGENEIISRHYPKCDIVFSSPLMRCIRTAELIYPECKPIIIDFGLFEGKNYIELAENKAYIDWIESGGTATFPNGESRDEANSRTMIGFQKLIKLSGDCKNISVVCHGGTIMAILSSLFDGYYYSYHVENGEGYTFDLSSDGLYHGLCTRSFIR